jgi:hypothetical protein
MSKKLKNLKNFEFIDTNDLWTKHSKKPGLKGILMSSYLRLKTITELDIIVIHPRYVPSEGLSALYPNDFRFAKTFSKGLFKHNVYVYMPDTKAKQKEEKC